MGKSFEEKMRCLNEPPPPAKPLVVPDLETHLQEERLLPMITLQTVLMALAFLFLALAAFGMTVPRVNAGWLGMAFWLLAILLSVRG